MATPQVFVISLIGLFCLFSLMTASLTFINIALRVLVKRFQIQVESTPDLLSAGHGLSVRCPITFEPIKIGLIYKNVYNSYTVNAILLLNT